MKKEAICPSCNNKIRLFHLKPVPWPEKIAWYKVGFQKYKLSCPQCGAFVKVQDGLDQEAKVELKRKINIFRISIFISLLVLVSGFHKTGLFLMAASLLMVISVVLPIATYGSRGVAGEKLLNLEIDNDL